MDDWTRVLLYGTFDGFTFSTDDSLRITVVLDGGEKVEVPEECVVSADETVNKYKIKLKDVIKRIENFDLGTKAVWINEILNKLGSDYGLHKYYAGYKQGKFDGAMEREKVTIPQFVADWINKAKGLGKSLYYALDHSPEEVNLWFCEDEANYQNIFARAWLDGYTVKKEPRYIVKMKNIHSYSSTLKRDDITKEYFFGNEVQMCASSSTHTRKELEQAGFGEVFNSPLFEVEEVENE